MRSEKYMRIFKLFSHIFMKETNQFFPVAIAPGVRFPSIGGCVAASYFFFHDMWKAFIVIPD